MIRPGDIDSFTVLNRQTASKFGTITAATAPLTETDTSLSAPPTSLPISLQRNQYLHILEWSVNLYDASNPSPPVEAISYANFFFTNPVSTAAFVMPPDFATNTNVAAGVANTNKVGSGGFAASVKDRWFRWDDFTEQGVTALFGLNVFDVAFQWNPNAAGSIISISNSMLFELWQLIPGKFSR